MKINKIQVGNVYTNQKSQYVAAQAEFSITYFDQHNENWEENHSFRYSPLEIQLQPEGLAQNGHLIRLLSREPIFGFNSHNNTEKQVRAIIGDEQTALAACKSLATDLRKLKIAEIQENYHNIELLVD